MKKIIPCICLFFICGCFFDNYEEDPLKKVQVGEMHNYSFNNNIDIQKKYQAINLVAWMIQDKEESIDYWQLPEETYNLKTGDCEDFALLLCYILETKLNLKTNLILLGRGNERHIIVQCENEYIAPINGYSFKNLFNNWYIIYVIPYEEAIWMTYYYHNNVGKYY